MASDDTRRQVRQQFRQPRPAESTLRRLLSGGGDLFRGDDYPLRLAEAAAGTQAPVLTGRRIAVVGARGGAGKTTVAALLARIYAAMRGDPVAAVDATPAAGTLGLRLGLPDAPPLDAAARRLSASPPPASLRDLAALLTVGTPSNLLVTGRRRPAGSAPDGFSANRDAATHLALAIARFCPITIFDCGSGLDPSGRWAVEQSHLTVFVTPAGGPGLADAADYAAHRRSDPKLAATRLLVVVAPSPAEGATRRPVVRPAAFGPDRGAGFLRRGGINAHPLSHDRHLAAGTELRPGLMARGPRLEAVALASRVLSLAVGEPLPAPAISTPSNPALRSGCPPGLPSGRSRNTRSGRQT